MKQALVFLCVMSVLIGAVRPTLAAVGVPEETDGASAKVIAVFVRADWDEGAQKMAAVFEGLSNRFDEERVLFVTLDLTNATARHQAVMLGRELGLVNAPEGMESQLGTIKFVSVVEKENVLSTLTPATTFEEASKELREALEKASEPEPASVSFSDF